MYPEPHLSFGLYLVAFVVALMFWNSCMVVMQYKEARKEELGIDTDDESAAPANWPATNKCTIHDTSL